MKKFCLVNLVFICLFHKAQVWLPIGTGTNGPVRALTVYNSKLHAGGTFSIVDNIPINGLASWDNNNWDSLGSVPQFTAFTALCVHNTVLIAGGGFTSIGGVSSNLVAAWDGATWSAMPGQASMGQILALSSYNNEVYIGNFQPMYFTKWNGSNTVPLSSSNPVFEFFVYNNELFAGGTFSSIQSVSANGIAKFDGTTWTALGSGATAVKAMAEYNGELYVGGNFSVAGGVTAGRIAKWDGTNWSTVGTGVGMNSSVESLCVYNGELYAGGQFTTVDSMSAAHIAKWNGTNWSAVGSGTDTTVWTMAVYNNELYVGGSFITAGGITCNHIARWNMFTSSNYDKLESQIHLFPNPSAGKLFIENESAFPIEKIEISDLNGKIQKLNSVPGNMNQIEVEELNAGIYFLRIYTSEGIVTRKVVIQR